MNVVTKQEAFKNMESTTLTGFKLNAFELWEGVWIISYTDNLTRRYSGFPLVREKGTVNGN